MTSNRATHDTRVLFKLLVVDNTCALNASRAKGFLDAQKRTRDTSNVESASGMNISRH